jgi:hypothetical protein
MTFRELTDYIYGLMQHGEHSMSEQVPGDVADMIRGGERRIDAAEYLAEKYDIGGIDG